MNTYIYDHVNYVEKRIALRFPEDKDSCLQLLTHQNYYSETHINLIIESSDYIIFHHDTSSLKEIVGFALVKLRKNHVLDVLLLCASPTDTHFGNMLTQSVIVFAIEHKCRKIYTSVQTPDLRNTFIKYGFESFIGVETIDEVLVKKINTIS